MLILSKNEFVAKLVESRKVTKDPETGLLLYKGIEKSEDFVYQIYKIALGQSFEGIFSSDADCLSIIQCTECRTLIAESYDEDYEENFACPVCTDYKTNHQFWIKEEIDKDPELQKMIDCYRDLAKYEKRYYDRIKTRDGFKRYNLNVARKKFKRLYYKNNQKKD